MKLVMQQPHMSACKQACIAMLSGKTLEQVISDAGTDEKIDLSIRQRLFALYGIGGEIDLSWINEPFSDHSFGALAREHETLLCSVYSWVNENYAHAVIFHRGELYDPYDGMNPEWPWHRFIGQITPVTPAQGA
jgi:hypothetical protein